MFVRTNVQEEYGNEQEQWKAQVDVYLQKLHVEATERATAMALASTEQQELEQKLWEVERKLEETEQQLQELSSKPQEQQQQPEQQQDAQQLLLTPRPSDWGPDRELAAACQVGWTVYCVNMAGPMQGVLVQHARIDILLHQTTNAGAGVAAYAEYGRGSAPAPAAARVRDRCAAPAAAAAVGVCVARPRSAALAAQPQDRGIPLLPNRARGRADRRTAAAARRLRRRLC